MVQAEDGTGNPTKPPTHSNPQGPCAKALFLWKGVQRAFLTIPNDLMPSQPLKMPGVTFHNYCPKEYALLIINEKYDRIGDAQTGNYFLG